MEDKPKQKRGGVRKPPSGYYSASAAANMLGMTNQMFGYYVRKGRIKKVVPPLGTRGFYLKTEIDQIALEQAVLYHIPVLEEPKTLTRVATLEDVPGVVNVLESMGWKTTPVALRETWYKKNPYLDHVVIVDGVVAGYITGVPYAPNSLEELMHGSRRGWDMTPDDIMVFMPGVHYELYTGIAVIQSAHNASMLAARLVLHFNEFLQKFAVEQRIVIEKLLAVSNEPDGMTLSERLGFRMLPAKPGDYGNRYALDMRSSDSKFAQIYREKLEASGITL